MLADGPVQKIEDLKGKVLATNAIGSGVDVAMRAMLRKHGLEANRDYTVIEAPFPAMRAMLAEKKVDLIPAVLPFSLDPELKKIAQTLFTSADAVGVTQFVMWSARKPFIDAHRAALVDFLEDSLRIMHWYLDPGEPRCRDADIASPAHQAAAGTLRLALHQKRLLPRSEPGAESRRAAEECRHDEGSRLRPVRASTSRRIRISA